MDCNYLLLKMQFFYRDESRCGQDKPEAVQHPPVRVYGRLLLAEHKIMEAKKY
jgi:hypothetical protein